MSVSFLKKRVKKFADKKKNINFALKLTYK